jgi:hypothetical protein
MRSAPGDECYRVEVYSCIRESVDGWECLTGDCWRYCRKYGGSLDLWDRLLIISLAIMSTCVLTLRVLWLELKDLNDWQRKVTLSKSLILLIAFLDYLVNYTHESQGVEKSMCLHDVTRFNYVSVLALASAVMLMLVVIYLRHKVTIPSIHVCALSLASVVASACSGLSVQVRNPKLDPGSPWTVAFIGTCMFFFIILMRLNREKCYNSDNEWYTTRTFKIMMSILLSIFTFLIMILSNATLRLSSMNFSKVELTLTSLIPVVDGLLSCLLLFKNGHSH